jgi:hypothetical protein
MAAADRQEIFGLYQRHLQEAVQEEEKVNPQREKQQERMRTYIRSQRRAVPCGGYIVFEEIQEEQERYLADLQALRSLMVNGARGPNGGYWLAYLKSKYPADYAYLKDLQIGSR